MRNLRGLQTRPLCVPGVSLLNTPDLYGPDSAEGVQRRATPPAGAASLPLCGKRNSGVCFTRSWILAFGLGGGVHSYLLNTLTDIHIHSRLSFACSPLPTHNSCLLTSPYTPPVLPSTPIFCLFVSPHHTSCSPLLHHYPIIGLSLPLHLLEAGFSRITCKLDSHPAN